MVEILRELLDVQFGDRQRKVAILERVVQLATDGVEWAVKMVMAYTDGLPAMRVAQVSVTTSLPDYSNFTDDELRQAAELARKAGKTRAGANGAGAVH